MKEVQLKLSQSNALRDSLTYQSAALTSELKNITYQSAILQKEAIALNYENKILKLNIEKMGQTSVSFLKKDEIPLIPSPPPQPSTFKLLPDNLLKNAKTYAQADSIISACFIKSGHSKRFYLGIKNGGFAIATPIEEIDIKGVVKNEETKDASSFSDFFKYFFSRDHLNDLFFSKKGYYRCVIVLVSPNLYSLGGTKISQTDIEYWINSNYIFLPSNIATAKLEPKTAAVALLYEFEQNENVDDKVQILNEQKCKTKFSQHQLIKSLLNEN
jgi:hypothetical protein